MIFSEPGLIECPDGYIPIPKSKEMNRRVGDGFDPIKIRVNVPLIGATLNDFHAVLARVLIQVNSSDELIPAYTQQLAKIPENNFIVGITNNAFQLIKSQYLSYIQSKKSGFDVTISTGDLFLFQKIKQRIPFS